MDARSHHTLYGGQICGRVLRAVTNSLIPKSLPLLFAFVVLLVPVALLDLLRGALLGFAFQLFRFLTTIFTHIDFLPFHAVNGPSPGRHLWHTFHEVSGWLTSQS
jgi:hypothetical protein